MPTYDYICNGCGAAVEIFQQITENPKRKCPECGKLRLKRQIGMGGGIIFRGEGFFCNDYPKKDK
jgi:putative FmdB family regulatory protein